MNIAVFCSGSGTNLQALIDAVMGGCITGTVSLVLSDKTDAFALERARAAGIATEVVDPAQFADRETFNAELIRQCEARNIELICLAGFMRILGPAFVDRYRNHIMNVHPALLPSFPGEHGVQDALDYGAKVTGVTIHMVDEGCDTGPIILQQSVDILPEDTPETLLERLHKVEHSLYPQAVQLFIAGKLTISGRKVTIIS